MSPAERGEVSGPGLPGRTTVVHLDVRVDVVEVAVTRRLVAVGMDAGAVAKDNELAHPRRRVVLVDAVRPSEVKHRLQREPARA